MARTSKKDVDNVEVESTDKAVTSKTTDSDIATETTEVEIIEETKEEKTNKASVKNVTRDIALNEYIDVRSVTSGSLSYSDRRTGLKYVWKEYGATQPIPYEVLLSMNASYPIYFSKPLVVIDDEAVIEKLNLSYIYEEYDFSIANNLENFFKLSASEIQVKLQKLPQCIKDNLKIKASELYSKGKLSDLNKIKVLENELKMDLMILGA